MVKLLSEQERINGYGYGYGYALCMQYNLHKQRKYPNVKPL